MAFGVLYLSVGFTALWYRDTLRVNGETGVFETIWRPRGDLNHSVQYIAYSVEVLSPQGQQVIVSRHKVPLQSLPFTSREDNRPVLQCVLFRVAEGELTIVSADGFRLAVVKLDFDGDEGQVLINRDELRGVISALRRAYRVRVSFEKNGESLDGMSLVLDTELIRYKWRSVDGNFPEYEKLLPAEFKTFVSFDANEAIKAVNSLKVLSDSKAYPIDLTIGNGKLTMSSPDDKGLAEIPADTLGDGKIRLDGTYLADALRACGGMVDLKLVDGKSPMLFTSPDYELVVMPMLTNESQKPTGEDKTAEPEAEAEQAEVEEAEKAQAVAEAEEITKAKSRHKSGKHKAKEPVAV